MRIAVVGPSRWGRRAIALIALTVLVPVIGLLGVDLAISLAASGQIHEDLDSVPEAPVALLLGTSKQQGAGPNLFYRPRIQAAADLYHAGRVRAVLVSGDNATRHYNEPWTMRRDLIALGVPEAHITLDYAGFRTLDSVLRAKAVFNQDRFVVVSQRFHAARALLIARHAGIQAAGFAAADPPGGRYLRVRLREVLARAVAVFDLLTGRGPRFLGDSEAVPLRPIAGPSKSKQPPCGPTLDR